MQRRLLILITALAALGSAEGATTVPSAWSAADSASFTPGAAYEQWWSSFGDATLDTLIHMGIANNYDLLMATRRIEIARQGVRQAQSAYYPQLSLSAGWNGSRSSGMMTDRSVPAQFASYFDVGVDMNWQIDIFGRIATAASAKKAGYRASRADYDAMMVTVTAKIATAYMQLRTLQTEMAVLNAHIRSQEHVCEIAEARHEAGLASMLDVTQARSTFYSTRATIASMSTQITSTIFAIATMLGVFPDEIAPMLVEPQDMPDYLQIVPVGVPADLLRRRPDVIEAEAMIDQYAAQLGVAKKDYLPQLSLTGSIGTQAHEARGLFTDRSYTYAIAPRLSWTIFDGLGRNAATAAAREQMQVGIDNYNLTVLTAVQEVNTAMTTYVNDLQYIAALSDAEAQAHRSFDMSLDLYKQGLTNFINVSDSQIALLQYANQVVVAKGQALAALISLYEALGGSF